MLEKIVGFFTTKKRKALNVNNHLDFKFESTIADAIKPIKLDLKIDWSELQLNETKMKKEFISFFEERERKHCIFDSLMRDNDINISRLFDFDRLNRPVIDFINFNRDNQLHELALRTPMSASDLEEMKTLLKSKFNVNSLGNDGDTPLHKAIRAENLPAIELLLVYGANLFLKNNDGKTPYQLASNNTLVKDLFNRNISVNEEVRKQKCEYNAEVVFDIIEVKSKLGVNYATYMSLPEQDGPVNTLKEICIEKVSELCSAARGR